MSIVTFGLADWASTQLKVIQIEQNKKQQQILSFFSFRILKHRVRPGHWVRGYIYLAFAVVSVVYIFKLHLAEMGKIEINILMTGYLLHVVLLIQKSLNPQYVYTMTNRNFSSCSKVKVNQQHTFCSSLYTYCHVYSACIWYLWTVTVLVSMKKIIIFENIYLTL